MKQLTFIDDTPRPHNQRRVVKQSKDWCLYVDGASRGNPGPAGAGIYLAKGDKPMLKKGYSIGKRTNNQAEYLALLLGLYHVQKKVTKGQTLTILADSELLVRQMIGVYKARSHDLARYKELALEMLKPYDYTINHIVRERNAMADAMANYGLDEKVQVPQTFIALLKRHEIPF